MIKNKFKIYWLLGIILLVAGGFWNTQRVSAGKVNIQNIFSNSGDSLTKFQKEIVVKFRKGNVAGLAEYFDEEVSLEILEESDFYSKEEAQDKLLEFCQNYTPKKFFVKHHGTNEKQNNYYLIGELITTKDKRFRVFISNNKTQIEIIRITTPLNL